MADEPDPEQTKAAEARLEAGKARLLSAYAQRETDPYALGEAVRALVDDSDFFSVLHFEDASQLLQSLLPQATPDDLLQAADVTRVHPREVVNQYGWKDVLALDELVVLEKLDRPSGDLSSAQVRVLDEHGKWTWIAFSDRQPGQLDRALAELRKAHDKPPHPRKPKPPPPPTPPPPAAPSITGRAFCAGLAVWALAMLFRGWILQWAQIAGLAAMGLSLWQAGSSGALEWDAWAHGLPGLRGLILGKPFGLIAHNRGVVLGVIVCGVFGTTWLAWQDRAAKAPSVHAWDAERPAALPIQESSPAAPLALPERTPTSESAPAAALENRAPGSNIPAPNPLSSPSPPSEVGARRRAEPQPTASPPPPKAAAHHVAPNAELAPSNEKPASETSRTFIDHGKVVPLDKQHDLTDEELQKRLRKIEQEKPRAWDPLK